MKKRLILILGPNGVGKTTTAWAILDKLTRCAMVDADWLRVMNPFALTAQTKETVIQNIYSLFYHYFACSEIDCVVFPYAFHGDRREMFEEVIRRLRQTEADFEVSPVVLKCDYEENVRRARKDGRDEARIARGMKNTFAFYDDLPYPKVDTTHLDANQAAQAVQEAIGLHRVFGKKTAAAYTDRVGAYLVPIQNGKVGAVRADGKYFLLGGGIEKGETDVQCIARECLEECGFQAQITQRVCSAELYAKMFLCGKMSDFHPIQTYYLGVLTQKLGEPIEKDHMLLWFDYAQIRGKLCLEMQNWALEKCWTAWQENNKTKPV